MFRLVRLGKSELVLRLFPSLDHREEMATSKHLGFEACDGGPLAVCINDCQLDYGQPSSELIRVCFQVRCAFAEMRWGSVAAAAFEAGNALGGQKATQPT
jgi:hypothetical protein